MTIFRYFGFRKQDGTFSITGRPTTGDDSPDARRFPISETFSEFTVDSIIECALKIRMRGGTFQMFFGYKDWREIHEKLAAIEAAKKEAKP